MSPRNSSGTMTLPAGNPVVTGSTISTTWANTTLGDLAAELTSSLDRTGRGGMTAPLRTADGTVAAPAHSFTSEVGSGLYRAAAGDLRLAVGGVDVAVFNGTNSKVMGVSPILQATATNTSASVQGNRAVTDTGVDVTLTSTAVRTAGLIAEVQNGGFGKLDIDYLGLVRLVNQAAALQPASIWTAITPDAIHTAANGLAYWKDAGGMVHVKGAVISGATVGGALNLVTTNPLPAGFRPSASRQFGISVNGTAITASVSPAGAIACLGSVTTGNSIYLDAIHFLAEA